jgi:hypothetical protein
MLRKVQGQDVKLCSHMKPKYQNSGAGEAARSHLFLGNVILTELFARQRIRTSGGVEVLSGAVFCIHPPRIHTSSRRSRYSRLETYGMCATSE